MNNILRLLCAALVLAAGVANAADAPLPAMKFISSIGDEALWRPGCHPQVTLAPLPVAAGGVLSLLALTKPFDWQRSTHARIRRRLPGRPEVNLSEARQKVTIKQGIEQPLAKKIVAQVKAAKVKVEVQINGDKLRVSGKKRDDLQIAIALLRKAELELPLQFENFRD
jgi:hypothetical protein